MLLSSLLTKKCLLCHMKINKGTVSRSVPVVGYIDDQKRDFCCEHHADHYEKVLRKAMKNHVPGCRTCYK